MAALKLGVLHTRRWFAFASDALRRLKRCYVIVVVALHEIHLTKAANKEHRDALLLSMMNYVFLCALFFMRDVMKACSLMSHTFQITQGVQHFRTIV